MNKPLSATYEITQKARDNLGLPHWYAMIIPWQDGGFGETTCALTESNVFVASFVHEGLYLGAYYATGHA